MKTTTGSRLKSLYFSEFHEYVKHLLLSTFHFVLLLILIIFLNGCSKNSSKDDLLLQKRDLLTSTIWGYVSICGYIKNPEINSCIFKSNGQYIEYSKMYQSTYGGNWSLKSNGNLIILGNEYRISQLNNSVLEISGGCGITEFKALKQTTDITLGVTALSKTSAKLHGSVRTCTLTNVSFEYGTSIAYENTATADNNSLFGPTIEIVSASLSGLQAETVYHYRIKAENSSGTYYGQDLTFRTFNNETVTDADNNIYNTITIGSQIWMAENLKTTKYRNGDAIPNITGDSEWSNLTTGAFYYNNYEDDTYGILYNWYTVEDNRNICPTGWHIPNNTEWTTLKQYLAPDIGSKLTEGGYDLDEPLLYTNPDSQSEASNESGFSARFSGNITEGSYFYTGYCNLWSSTEDDLQNAQTVVIWNGFDVPFLIENKKSFLAVRCVKD